MQRTTSLAISNAVMLDNQRTLSRMATYQEQLSSGKRINRVSDDPVQARSALRYRAESVQTGKFMDNIGKGQALLTTADNALSEMGKAMDEAKQLAVQGANASQDAASRATLATSVDSLLERMVDLANSVHDGRYVFAGTATTTKPFAIATDGETVSYQGNIDTYKVQIGNDSTVDLNRDGHTLFQGDVDVFGSLVALRNALKDNDPTAVADLITQVDAGQAHLSNIHGAMGGTETRLELASNQLQSAKNSLDSLTSQAEDVDFAKTLSDYQMAESSLTAGLQAAAKVIRSTLLDYL
jgi:flagellar hook-associated protein 3 FlgL